MRKRIAVVGGIPNPIGGVTSFIRRVVRLENEVTHLFDLYPSGSKKLPEEFSGEFVCGVNKYVTLIRLFLFCLRDDIDFIHFNFSTPRALLLLLLLPKFRAKWGLTLHHGDLGGDLNSFFCTLLSRKIDVALSLNHRQFQWYTRNALSKTLERSCSYVEPSEPCPSVEFAEKVSGFKEKYNRIFVCSGYPTHIYNHFKAIDLMGYYKDDLLVVCIYGGGPLVGEIELRVSRQENSLLVNGLSEDDFNFLLANADLYLRLNSEDSFGIAVADSVVLGTICISTDVCPRYPGAVLISPFCTLVELKNTVEDVFSESSDLRKASGSFATFRYKRIRSLNYD